MHKAVTWKVLLLALAVSVPGMAAEPRVRLRTQWQERDARVDVFSPDGGLVVASGHDGQSLRETATGRIRVELHGSAHGLLGTAFSPDGRLLLATVSSDRHKPVLVQDLKLWNAATGEIYATHPHVSEVLNDVSNYFYSLSPNVKTLAFIDNADRLPMDVVASKVKIDGRRESSVAHNKSPGLPRVKLWDVPSRKERAVLEAGPPLVFSPDSKKLVTGSRAQRDTTARVWDTETGALLSEFDTAGPWVMPLTFSPDGKLLAHGGFSGGSLYELETGRRWPVLVRGYGTGVPFFSRDGRILFPSGMRTLSSNVLMRTGDYCYDLASLPPARFALMAGEMAISPDGSRYAYTASPLQPRRDPFVFLIDLPSMRETGRFPVEGLEAMAFSPDGKWLALLVKRHFTVPGDPAGHHVRSIQLVDPRSPQVVLTVPSPAETWAPYGWKFSSNSKLLAVSYPTGSNVHGPGEPDPSERPSTLEIWEIED